jgi:hypothetical protein|tara:strand:- start:370 stop:1335 length:966 start_codon:yes stop_codon:yes gene_type:complete
MPIYPISFSIPRCKIVEKVPKKNRDFPISTPRNWRGKRKYPFKNEEDYYKDYKESFFANTKRKSGWDCMRHYEILANGCIPMFENFEKRPQNTMTNFPWEKLKEAYDKLDPSKLNKALYNKFCEDLISYTKKNLTTISAAKYILNKSNLSSAKNILFLRKKDQADYLSDLCMHGFKELFKKSCHEYPCANYLYKDFNEVLEGRVWDSYNDACSKLYGRGFTYSKNLDRLEYGSQDQDAKLKNNIEKRHYDTIIYGDFYRPINRANKNNLFEFCNQTLNMTSKYYNPQECILLCGEDAPTRQARTTYNRLSEQGYNVFIREL